jgi:hypothetical protein
LASFNAFSEDLRSKKIVAWFTFELVVRFVVWPDHKRFFLSAFNIFDLISTVPYHVYFATSPSLAVMKDVSRVFKAGSLFRLFRISNGLNLMMVTTVRSYKDIGIYILYLAMGVDPDVLH